MTLFKLYPEIPCPLCRIDFGYVSKNKENIYQHHSLFSFLESIVSVNCSNQNLIEQNTASVDIGKVVLTEELQEKLKEIEKQNKTDPDYSSQNCTWEQFYFVLNELVHWTNLSFVKDDESIKPMDFYKVKEMFEDGKTVKEIIQFYVVKDD